MTDEFSSPPLPPEAEKTAPPTPIEFFNTAVELELIETEEMQALHTRFAQEPVGSKALSEIINLYLEQGEQLPDPHNAKRGTRMQFGLMIQTLGMYISRPESLLAAGGQIQALRMFIDKMWDQLELDEKKKEEIIELLARLESTLPQEPEEEY